MKRLLLFALILLTACDFSMEQELDPAQFMGEEKLVINSMISPADSLIQVYVTLSESKAKEFRHRSAPRFVENARVELSGGNQSVVLEYAIEDTIREIEYIEGVRHDFETPVGVYQIPAEDFLLQGGTEYFLNVTTPDGLQASASCRLPQQEVELDWEFEAIKRRDEHCQAPPGMEEYCEFFYLNVRLNWQDEASTNDFYLLQAQRNEAYWRRSHEDTTRQLFQRKHIVDFRQPSYFSDELKNGLAMSKVMPLDVELSGNRSFNEYDYLEIELLHLSEYLYEYAKLWDEVFKDEAEGYFILDEPQTLPSNIEGGYGIFAAYNVSEATVYFKDYEEEINSLIEN